VEDEGEGGGTKEIQQFWQFSPNNTARPWFEQRYSPCKESRARGQKFVSPVSSAFAIVVPLHEKAPYLHHVEAQECLGR